MEDVDSIALMYAEKRPTVLPEYVFISVRIYNSWLHSLGVSKSMSTGLSICAIHTSVGPLQIKILPWASDAKLFMVGRMDDFERYDVDKIFEKIVLADCEREP